MPAFILLFGSAVLFISFPVFAIEFFCPVLNAMKTTMMATRLKVLAFVFGLLALPQGMADTVISAENLSGSRGVAPDLVVSLTELDNRIAANQDPKQRQQLELQRHWQLQQLAWRIAAGETADLAPAVAPERLFSLRDQVEQARRSGDLTREMTAVLKLNTAILDAAFGRLLDVVPEQWSSFAPASTFERSLAAFRKHTRFNQIPFQRAVAHIHALPAAQRNPDEVALVDAYDAYKQHTGAYDAVLASLQDLFAKAISGDPLLRWLNIGALIERVNALPGIADVNAALSASRRLTLGQVVAAVVVFLALTGIGFLLLPLLVRRISRLLSRSRTCPTEAQRLTQLLRLSFGRPLQVLLLLAALGLAGRILLLREPDAGLVTAFDLLVVLLVVWALLRLIDSIVIVYSEPLHQRYPKLRGELINFLSNLIRFTIIIVTALYLLHDLGYDISTLLASLGIGGLAVAFAAKESIANIFGCISIIADDMFSEGDWIVTPDADGTVIDVGLRSTKIRTFDNAIVFIPNAYLAGMAVRNWSRRKLGRRILFNVGLEYGSDMAMVRKTVDDIRAMLVEHPETSDSTTDTSQYTRRYQTRIANALDSQGVMKTLLVYLDNLGESSINIMVYCFSKSVDWEEWLKVKQDVIYRCCDIVQRNGLSMAFPSQTLYLREDAPAPDAAGKTTAR